MPNLCPTCHNSRTVLERLPCAARSAGFIDNWIPCPTCKNSTPPPPRCNVCQDRLVNIIDYPGDHGTLRNYALSECWGCLGAKTALEKCETKILNALREYEATIAIEIHRGGAYRLALTNNYHSLPLTPYTDAANIKYPEPEGDKHGH